MEYEKGAEEEEDISVDLGKIKNIFGRKKKKETEKTEEKAKKEIGKEEIEKKKEFEEELQKEKIGGEKEEVSLDFGKIKGFFKRKKEKSVDGKEGEEEISLDFKKWFGILNKNKKVLLPLFLILIAIFLSIYIRTQPANLPVTEEWAENSVYNYLKGQIRAEIDKQYPNLPDSNKDVLVENEFQKLLEQQKDQIEQQIKGTADYFRSEMQDEAGRAYMFDIDPYFWMRHTRNVINNGHPGDILKDGKPYDNHMLAPIGRYVPQDMFHAYFQAYVFKIWNFFNPRELKDVAFYVPVIISIFAVIPAYFIARRVGGDLAGFVAAVIVAVHPVLMTRTIAGVSDTDIYNVFFPLMITWLFLIAFEAKEAKRRYIFTGLTGFFVGLFSFTWGGWWYMFDFILATAILYMMYYAIIHRKDLLKVGQFLKQPPIENTLILIVVLIVVSGVFTILFGSFGIFKSAFAAPIGFAKLKEVGVATLWPNVYTTVAEQNPISLSSAISQIGFGGTSGGKFFFGVIIIGLILTVIRKDMHGKFDVKYAILLSMWLIATLYASTKGVRFSLLAVPAAAVAFGIALGRLHEIISKWISKELNVSKILISSIIFVLIVFGFLITPVKAGLNIVNHEIPLINDAWYNSLDKINKEASPNAIINSWWDYGHWFKYIGDRPVTFDGTSQNMPQAHWIGKALLTDNENVTVGILRMLDCGANTAFEKVNEKIKDPVHSIGIINEIIVLDREGAKKVLGEYGFSDKEIEDVIQYSHCEPPEDYFITSNDMMQKSGVWAHFGSWNFERAQIYNTLYDKDKTESIEYLKERFNYTENEAENTYDQIQSFSKGGKDVNDWIAPWPSYASGLNGCSKSEGVITCNIGQGGRVIINTTTMDASIPTAQGNMYPNSIVYVTENDVVEKKFKENTIGLGLILIPSGNEYKNILASPELAKSMFTRLFYLQGHGLSHFELFSHEKSPIGGDEIYVWKVDWNGSKKNIVEEFFPEEEAEQIINETNKTTANKTLNSSENSS